MRSEPVLEAKLIENGIDNVHVIAGDVNDFASLKVRYFCLVCAFGLGDGLRYVYLGGSGNSGGDHWGVDRLPDQ